MCHIDEPHRPMMIGLQQVQHVYSEDRKDTDQIESSHTLHLEQNTRSPH